MPQTSAQPASPLGTLFTHRTPDEDATQSTVIREMLATRPRQEPESKSTSRAARFEERFGFDPLEIIDVFSGLGGSGFLKADALRGEKIGNLLAAISPFKLSPGMLRRLLTTGKAPKLLGPATARLSTQPVPRLVGAMIPKNATDLRLSFDLRYGELPTLENIRAMFPDIADVLHIERFGPNVFRPADGTIRISISTLKVSDPNQRKQILEDLLQQLGGQFREGRIPGPSAQ